MKKYFFYLFSIYFLTSTLSYAEQMSKQELFVSAKTAEKQGHYDQAIQTYTDLASITDNGQIRSFILKKLDKLKALKDSPEKNTSTLIAKPIVPIKTKAEIPDIEKLSVNTPVHKARLLEQQGKINEAIELYNTIIADTTSAHVKRFAQKRIAILSAKEKGLLLKKEEEKSKQAAKKPEITEPALSVEQESSLESKITKSQFLLQSGDALCKEGKIEDAFKMYKIALESLA